MDENHREHLRNHQSVSQLLEWTRALLERLGREGRVPVDVVKSLGGDGDVRRIDEKHYEKVAKALEAHLAISGEYKYSLDLKRQDTKLDPVEDFLFNIRKGHCSRYATALTLMLRTLGVPTRIVLGFRGMEVASDGLYEIRQCHAHAWVEALIRREQPGRPATWHWLTLDPTPATEDVETAQFQWGNLWDLTRNEVSQFFRHFIVEYDADQQDRAYSLVGGIRWLSFGETAQMAFLGADGDNWSRAMFLSLCGLALLYGAIRLVRWRRSRSTPPPDPSTAFFRRLLDVLARHLNVRPEGGQTPREFAAIAAERLQAAPALRGVEALPTEAVRLYYRVRYGGQPLDPHEQQDLDGRLDRFEKALAGARLSTG
jgi:hypothetical protein